MDNYVMTRSIFDNQDMNYNNIDVYNNCVFRKFMTKNNGNNNNIHKMLNQAIKMYHEAENNNNYDSMMIQKKIIEHCNNRISQLNNINKYSMIVNNIINDLNYTVDSSSPIMNSPNHPFTKLHINRDLMVGTQIIPDDNEYQPEIIINDDGTVTGTLTDIIRISGFTEYNFNQIYNRVLSSNDFNVKQYNNGELDVKLYDFEFDHINGDVLFERFMTISPDTKTMFIIKHWNIQLTQ
jgi:hypothetical protein